MDIDCPIFWKSENFFCNYFAVIRDNKKISRKRSQIRQLEIGRFGYDLQQIKIFTKRLDEGLAIIGGSEKNNFMHILTLQVKFRFRRAFLRLYRFFRSCRAFGFVQEHAL